jgi:transcription elongation GreA/GreB family factor
VAERIKVAIRLGDISENAEYDEAKTSRFCRRQDHPAGNMLRVARVVDDDV